MTHQKKQIRWKPAIIMLKSAWLEKGEKEKEKDKKD